MYPSRRNIVMTLTPRVKPGVSLLSSKSCFVVAGLLQSVCTSVPQLIVLQRVSTGSSVTLCHMVLSARPRLTDLHSSLLMYVALMLFFSWPSRSSHMQPSFRPPVQQVQRYCGSIPWSTCWVLGFLPFWNIKLYISHLVSKHSLTDKWIIVIAKQPHFWQQMAELPEVRLLLQASNEAMTCE